MYINDLHQAIKHSIVHHFADDTNLLYADKSIKQLTLKINHDLSCLCEWLRANKLSLNVKKTELIIFRSPHSTICSKYKFKIEGKKLNPTNTIKYLGVHMDEHLTWKIHFGNVNSKLNRAIGILSKLRHHISFDVLRSVYFALFYSHMTYGSQIWGQSNHIIINKIQCLQNRALKKISFWKGNTNTLYKNLNMLKFIDITHLQNCIFMHSFVRDKLVPVVVWPSGLRRGLSM